MRCINHTKKNHYIAVKVEPIEHTVCRDYKELFSMLVGLVLVPLQKLHRDLSLYREVVSRDAYFSHAFRKDNDIT